MPLSQEDFERARAHVSARPMTCPACGSKAWVIADVIAPFALGASEVAKLAGPMKAPGELSERVMLGPQFSPLLVVHCALCYRAEFYGWLPIVQGGIKVSQGEE